uniref:UPAR/Ly6 domain-containing protein n=1 Tax=Gouania willdenowi TaxID=441366 RepID=A0A8C5D5E3_GOUWI
MYNCCVFATVGALQCQSCSDRQNEFLKACAPSSLCPSTGNRTFQSNSGLSSTVTLAECCNTDNCNTRTLPAPSRNETKSGLSCHFCANPSVCDVELQCEGSEDRCFRANGKTLMNLIINHQSVFLPHKHFTQHFFIQWLLMFIIVLFKLFSYTRAFFPSPLCFVSTFR